MPNMNLQSAYMVADTVALDADGIAGSQTPAAGGAQNLTLGGALTSGGSATFTTGRVVTITSAGDESARTFTVTGTDLAGVAQSEVINGVDTATATGTKYFLTVTQIQVDANTAAAVTAGINNSVADVIFADSCRVKAMFLVNSATAGTITFAQGSATGTQVDKLATVASATVQTNHDIPEGGVRFVDGAYIRYVGGGSAEFTAMTVYYG